MKKFCFQYFIDLFILDGSYWFNKFIHAPKYVKYCDVQTKLSSNNTLIL